MPFASQKSKFLKKVECIYQDEIKDMVQKFKSSEIEKFGEEVFSTCIYDWERFYKNLDLIKNYLLEYKLINPIHLTKLCDLLDLIATCDSGYVFPVFASGEEAKDFFEKLYVASLNLIVPFSVSPESLKSKVVVIKFDLHKLDGDSELFNVSLSSDILRANLCEYTNIYAKRTFGSSQFAIEVFGEMFCVDRNLSIEVFPDLSSCYLVYLDTVRIPIQPDVSNDINIIMLKDVDDLYLPNTKLENDQEKILFIIEFLHHNGFPKSKEYRISKVDDFIKENIIDRAKKIEMITSDEGSFEIRVSDGKFMRQREVDGEFNVEVECLKGMKFKITLLRELGHLYDSLDCELTLPGKLQINFLGDHLKNLSSIFRSEKTFFAAFSGLIQSSGFGKTKICLDLLKDHPGIYFVFRREGQTGVPRMANWMKRFLTYVKEAHFDSLPDPLPYATANDSTPGRFLIALKILLETYKSFIVERIAANVEKSEILNELRLFFAEGPLLNCVPSELFNGIYYSSPRLTFSNVATELKDLLESILNLLGEKDFPFLLFLDELDVFDFGENSGRPGGWHIVRCALHCLETEALMFTLAIGTHLDVSNFRFQCYRTSLRNEERIYFLPPFILSGNWDIFLYSVPYQDIVINHNSLTNSAMFNVLSSYGRPLWSSLRLDQVVTIAEAKLRNISSSSNESLLSLLLVRSNLPVNVHHKLARTLIRSYMMILNYISTDASDIKMSYSSEPILAIAARSCLSGRITRYNSFLALRDLLIKSAIENERISETIFQYLVLFAIDDAKMDTLNYHDDPDAPEFPELVREKITRCKSFLLNSQVEKYTVVESKQPSKSIDPDLASIRKRLYRCLTVKEMLSSLLNGKFEEFLFKIIKFKTQEAIIGTSHFIQLETAQMEDFENIPNFQEVHALGRKIIDRALLKVGVRKQCGFTMPSNYFGIDFILPISIKRADNGRSNTVPENDLFSFIAVQSKSSKPDIVECAFKMSGLFHLCRCPNKTHLNESDCIEKGCKAYFKMEDLISILDDQVVVLLTTNGFRDRTQETTVSLKGRRVIEEDVPNLKKSRTIETDQIILDARKKFGDEVSSFEDATMKSVNYPEYFARRKIRNILQPDIILTKTLSKRVTVQKMCWSYKVKDLECLLEKRFDMRDRSDNVLRRRSLTCISINNVDFFKHLIDGEKGIKLLKNLINFTPSRFDNINPIFKPILQNSMLNGVHCPYYEFDSKLPMADPLANYEKVFTRHSLELAMNPNYAIERNEIVDSDSDSDSDSETDSEFEE